jgi:hypothetical protein
MLFPVLFLLRHAHLEYVQVTSEPTLLTSQRHPGAARNARRQAGEAGGLEFKRHGGRERQKQLIVGKVLDLADDGRSILTTPRRKRLRMPEGFTRQTFYY